MPTRRRTCRCASTSTSATRSTTRSICCRPANARARRPTTPASARASSRPSATASIRAASSWRSPSTRRWRSPTTRSGSTSSSSTTSTSPSVTATRSSATRCAARSPRRSRPIASTAQSQQYLTFGARVRPVAGLVLDAGLDIGLSSYGFRYGSPLPTWNVLLGAAYAYDPGAGRGRTKVVTKTITREIMRGAVQGKLRGFVRDATTKKAIGGATIKLHDAPRDAAAHRRGRQLRQLRLRAGTAVARGLARRLRAGQGRHVGRRQRRDAARGAADGQAAGGDRRARQRRRRRAACRSARRRCALTNTSSGAVVDAQPEGMAGFCAKLPPGDWMHRGQRQRLPGQVSAPITVVAGQPQQVEIVLRKKPTTSHVTLGRTRSSSRARSTSAPTTPSCGPTASSCSTRSPT